LDVTNEETFKTFFERTIGDVLNFLTDMSLQFKNACERHDISAEALQAHLNEPMVPKISQVALAIFKREGLTDDQYNESRIFCAKHDIGKHNFVDLKKTNMKLKLPDAEEPIKYTPILLARDLDHLVLPSLPTAELTGVLSNEADSWQWTMIHQADNVLARQRGGESVLEGRLETSITASFAKELFHLPHRIIVGRNPRRKNQQRTPIPEEFLEVMGIGTKEAKAAYRYSLVNKTTLIPDSTKKGSPKKWEERLDEINRKIPVGEYLEHLWQETYKPQPLKYNKWFEAEFNWHAMNTTTCWYDTDENPKYTIADEWAESIKTGLLSEFRNTKLAETMQIHKSFFSTLAKEWQDNSRGACIKIPIRSRLWEGEGSNQTVSTKEERIHGFVIRSRHFATKTQTTVPLLVVQFMKEPRQKDMETKYKHHTIFKVQNEKYTKWLSVKRHGTTLMKAMTLANCHRALIPAMDCCTKGVIDQGSGGLIALEARSKIYAEGDIQTVQMPNAFLYHAIEQHLSNVYGGSQSSAFHAEMRRMQLIKSIAAFGDVYSLKNEDELTARDKAQDAVINNPNVLYLANCWNATMHETVRSEEMTADLEHTEIVERNSVW
jgi:hypothetical protein